MKFPIPDGYCMCGSPLDEDGRCERQEVVARELTREEAIAKAFHDYWAAVKRHEERAAIQRLMELGCGALSESIRGEVDILEITRDIVRGE